MHYMLQRCNRKGMFAKGEQVILSREVLGSDSFPLIRVDIDTNRKSVLSEMTGGI